MSDVISIKSWDTTEEDCSSEKSWATTQPDQIPVKSESTQQLTLTEEPAAPTLKTDFTPPSPISPQPESLEASQHFLRLNPPSPKPQSLGASPEPPLPNSASPNPPCDTSPVIPCDPCDKGLWTSADLEGASSSVPKLQSPSAMSVDAAEACSDEVDTLIRLWNRNHGPEFPDSQETVFRPPISHYTPVSDTRPRFGEQERQKKWDDAETAALAYPIYFSEIAGWPGHDLTDELRRVAGSALARGHAFYVGATTDPLHRWVGSEAACRGGRVMRGHARGLGGVDCDEMFIIGLLPSYEAKKEEARLIRLALEEYRNCLNVAPDARGQVRADNFLYVVVQHDAAL